MAGETERRLFDLEMKIALQAQQNETIISRLDKIDGHVSKLVWLVIGTILTGFVTFAMSGGLKIG